MQQEGRASIIPSVVELASHCIIDSSALVLCRALPPPPPPSPAAAILTVTEPPWEGVHRKDQLE
jgi:hypothetical protein